MTTAHSEISTVTRSACVTSESARAALKLAKPSAKARCPSVITGQPTSMNTYAATTSRTAHLAGAGSSTTTRHPPLQDVERHDHDQRQRQHDGRQRSGRRPVAALDEAQDPHGDGLRP